MAQGKPKDCEIVRARDTCIFHYRVRHSPSPQGPSTTRVDLSAGCDICVTYKPGPTKGEIVVILGARLWINPASEGAKLVVKMVLLDKTGSATSTAAVEEGISCRQSSTVCCCLNLKLDDAEANCVVDNYFEVLCSVEVIWTPAASTEERLPDLGHDLATMAADQELTDVTLHVNGESFSAHRLVLAARSPVFKAELFGHMAESKLVSIVIQDMEASTFRTMLHYMYHGSLPKKAGKIDVSSTMTEYQHLLVAADRYGLESLKNVCEEKLCRGGIAIDTVVSMLELAEVHGCLNLKSMCFDFLADGENFKMVATSGQYFHLMQSFPSLLVEMRNRFKIASDKPITRKPTHKKIRLCE